ncbi:MAG: hypothetical protein C4297_04245 [Gemmataceae bacterium]
MKAIAQWLAVVAILWAATRAVYAQSGTRELFASRSMSHFQRWQVWDTLPDLPGLRRRCDLRRYRNEPVCTIEDYSLSHDPRFVSPEFAIPPRQWMRITAVVSADIPLHPFTLGFVYRARGMNQVTASLQLPLTVVATDRWRSATLLVPPAELAAQEESVPKGTAFTHGRLEVRPILYGSYFGGCQRWHIQTGRIHIASVAVEALPERWQPAGETRSDWFEFPTGLLPPGGEPAVSFAFLHHRPAGKLGHVRLHADGYLVFADGTPVRFWGVGWHENYPRSRFTDCPLEEHERIARTFGALGINFVRWHGLLRGLRDAKVRDRFQLARPEVWDRADRLLATLAQQGVYFQATLWGFDEPLRVARENLPPEIASDQAWLERYATYRAYHQRKWAIFCLPMRQESSLWHRILGWDEQIMAHVNPYRRARYADDPACAIVQPINEVSMLAHSPNDGYLLGEGSLPAGVRDALQAEWNRWLYQRFGTRDQLLSQFPQLAREWQAAAVERADPRQGTVPLPPGPRHTLRRQFGSEELWWHRLFMEFSTDYERQLYDAFRQRMRAAGYRGALGGDAGGVWRGQLVTHAQLDIAYDRHHPYTDGETTSDVAFALNRPYPLQSVETNLYEVSTVGAAGKATIVSEWSAGTVNEWRAMLPILTAVYAAMQQVSAVAEHTFGYPGGRPSDRHAVAPGFGNLLGDPARIGPYPVAATLFTIPEAIAAPTLKVCELFTDEDLYAPIRGLQGDESSEFLGSDYLAHVARVRWARWDGRSANVPDADMYTFPLTTGIGNLRALPPDRKLLVIVPPEVLYSGWRIQQPYERVRSLYPGLRFRTGEFRVSVRLGKAWDDQFVVAGRLIELASLPAGATAIGVDIRQRVCWAFYDRRSIVIADAAILQHCIAPLIDAALKSWGLLPQGRGLVDRGEIVSATGQLRRNWQQGWVAIDSDYAQVLMGDLSRAPALRHLEVSANKAQFGIVALVPLERRPLKEARRWFLVALGKVANRDYEAVCNEPMGIFRWSGVRLKTGQGPPVCEPLSATAVLKQLKVQRATVTALKANLTPLHSVSVGAVGEAVHVPLHNAKSIWLTIEPADRSQAASSGQQ